MRNYISLDSPKPVNWNKLQAELDLLSISGAKFTALGAEPATQDEVKTIMFWDASTEPGIYEPFELDDVSAQQVLAVLTNHTP